MRVPDSSPPRTALRIRPRQRCVAVCHRTPSLDSPVRHLETKTTEFEPPSVVYPEPAIVSISRSPSTPRQMHRAARQKRAIADMQQAPPPQDPGAPAFTFRLAKRAAAGPARGSTASVVRGPWLDHWLDLLSCGRGKCARGVDGGGLELVPTRSVVFHLSDGRRCWCLWPFANLCV